MHHARDAAGDDIGVCAFHLRLRIPFKINDLRASCKLIQNRISEAKKLTKQSGFRLISHKTDGRYTKQTSQSTPPQQSLARLRSFLRLCAAALLPSKPVNGQQRQ
jgi:hypothetical protein